MVLNRLIAQFVEQYIVRALADNRNFQKFALKIDKFIHNKKENLDDLAHSVRERMPNLDNHEIRRIDVKTFVKTFLDEVLKGFSQSSGSSSAGKK
jgi:hypothetical protein